MVNPYYITGLVDGEGSFTYSKNTNGKVYPYFAIKLNIADLPLLEKVREFFGGMGTIYKSPPRTYRLNDSTYTSGAMANLKIFRKDELLKLVWHFLEYPLEGKKAAAFQVWKEIVMLRVVNRPWDEARITARAAELTKANGGKIKKPRKKNVVDTGEAVR